MDYIVLMWIGIVLISLLLLMFIRYKKSNKKQNRKIVQLFNDIFNLLNNISFLSPKLQSIRVRIYNNALDEDWLIKYRAILYIGISDLVGLISLIFVILYFSNNLYVAFTLIFFSFQIRNMTLDFLIGNDTNFLVGIYNYSVELQQAFSLTKDVRSAIIEANNNSMNFNLVKRMEKVESILDDPVEVEKYITDCPNDYLKLLIINCNLVNEYGDQKDADNKSIFLENIFYNNQNIETEVFKRRQLEFWLRGMALLCILPLLAFSPYDIWVNLKLPITDIFYKTRLGFVVKILLTLLCVGCFYRIKIFENISKKRSNKTKNTYWEEKFFKIPIIRDFIKLITPKDNSIKGYKYKNIISASGEYTRVEYIYLRKVLFSLIGFFLMLSLSASIHEITRFNVLENQLPKFKNSILVTMQGQEYSAEIEKSLIKDVDLKNLPGTYDVLARKLEEKGITSNTETVIKRVIEKKTILENEYLNIYDILLSLMVSVLLYFIPEALLKMKAKMRKQEMENEIIIFETIILIFMYHESTTSELILETMSKFAVIFKAHVDEALKEIRKSDEEALEALVQEIKYKPFLNLIKNIIKAENIKVKDAFISLADNRRNYLMNRKEENRRIVSKSVSKSALISIIPINLIIVAYMAVPMLYVAFSQLDSSQNQMLELENNQQKNMEYKIIDQEKQK